MAKPQGGLGRGLGSLIPQAPQQPQGAQTRDASGEMQEDGAAGGGMRILHIAPSVIAENPYQPRKHFAAEELDDLTASIKEHGILQPLVVTMREDGRYELIAGERRLRAARAVGLKDVPVVVREADRKQKLELALIENIQREDLNPVEEAIAYRQLADEFHLTQEEIGARVGKSRPQVANTLRLLDLSEEMLDAVRAGRLSRSHARTLLAEDDSARREELFVRMLHGGVTVRDAEETVRVHTRRGRTQKDPNIAEIEKTLREKMGTKVEIKMNATGSGTIVVHFFSKDDLKALIAHLE